MTRHTLALTGFAGLLLTATYAWPHDCRVLGNSYLAGEYAGDCDERTERAQGNGEARGADTYIGSFVKGKPDGKGTYTWENGARLDGYFKEGKAHGAGTFTSATGVRYDGEFANGKLEGLKAPDCPKTPGPLVC